MAVAGGSRAVAAVAFLALAKDYRSLERTTRLGYSG